MNTHIKTAATEMLGIEYPIMQGCMQWIAKAELAAAVSEAGGLGIISSSTFFTAEDLRGEIKKVREKTDKPFAVNITFLPASFEPDFDGYIRVCIEEGVKIIETAGRLPSEERIAKIKGAGIIWIHKCTIVKHALKAQNAGCDMIVADGFECAGHPGENDIGSMVLTPSMIQALNIPVITAGGVGTGRQMAAALMLGAAGVYLGTRFLLTEECPVLDAVKKNIAEKATEMDTALMLRSYTNTTRVYKTNMTKSVIERERAGAKFPEVAGDINGAKVREMFFETGDVENSAYICVGETVGLIHDILPVKDAIESMMAECVETIHKFC
ncbi:MAG TPA: nitronate monooxygenase [Candidatus Scatomorpha pullistercoris]|uniref:Probable nitronate monooxygenase n=1 Tax=Candidatus Scatomorpha pullistercoris TaxID=2840929 RepID=A0A9D1G2S7_9FIRM|nr:nitronate monooxygenase [Candidatus Scatomorpha pullistercoris]